jgi:thiol:disulfide interchange protein
MNIAALAELLALSFAGGLVLNVMPCVLPVLTMKVFHMVEYADADARTHRVHGLAYLGGVLATFAVFTAGVLALKAAGEAVGWGMQFSNPSFVAVLTALVFVFGLNALGVFEMSLSLVGREGGRAAWDSFLNGVVASVMSTPCTAPFLSTAATFALAAEVPAWQTILIFQTVGLGLAFPFTLVSFVPAFSRVLPRPGAWMESFKVLMGFSLIAASVWLFGTLQHQLTEKSSTHFLYFLVIVAVVLWAWQRFGGPQFLPRRRAIVTAVSAGSLALAGWGFVDLVPRRHVVENHGGDAIVHDGRINWAGFDPGYIAALRESGRPVFIDYTAEWCANCKANERLFIETDPVREVLVSAGIVPVKADLTNENETILEWLDEIERSGLPAYAIYMPDGTVDVLPQVITTELLVERLSAASERFPPSGFADAPARPSAACPLPSCPTDSGDETSGAEPTPGEGSAG